MLLERLAVLIGGLATGMLLRRWQGEQPATGRGLERSARELRADVRAQQHRLTRVEARLDAHEAKLKEIPSGGQLIAAMDEILAKAMSGLDARLTAQARSIESLQTTVSETDELLERMLESLDALREE